MSKSRNWCFTLNNPKAIPDLRDDRIKYACFQEETGETGTHHIQGYLELRHPLSLTGVRNLTQNCGLDGAHFEPRRGTAEQARDYCRKPGGWGFQELGTFTGMQKEKRHCLVRFERLPFWS